MQIKQYKQTSAVEGPIRVTTSQKEQDEVTLGVLPAVQTVTTSRTSHSLDIAGDLTTVESVRTGIKALTGTLVTVNLSDEWKVKHLGYTKADDGSISAGPEDIPEETALAYLERRFDGSYKFYGILAVRFSDPGSNASYTSTDSASFEPLSIEFSARSVVVDGKPKFIIEEENVTEERIGLLLTKVHTARFNEGVDTTEPEE